MVRVKLFIILLAFIGINAYSANPVIHSSGSSNMMKTNTVASEPTDTILKNGDFSNGFEYWHPSVWGDAKGEFIIENGMAKLNVANPGTFTYNIMLYEGISLKDSIDYIIEFDIKSDTSNRKFEVVLEHYGEPYNKYLWKKCQTSEEANKIEHFKIDIRLQTPDLKTKLGFHFGSQAYGKGTVWIGNIIVKRRGEKN